MFTFALGTVACAPTMAPLPSVVATGNAPTALVVGDWNGDDARDLAVTNRLDNNVTILLGNGDGTFTDGSRAPEVGSDPRGVATGDLDDDGDADLVVSSIGYLGRADVRVLIGDGDGTFTLASTLSGFDDPRTVVVVDMDGDDHLDALVANDASAQVSVLRGDGSGALTATAAVPTGEFPWGLAAVDVDGDAATDIVTADRDSGTLSIARASGGATQLDVGDTPRPLATGDLDDDGLVDLVVGREHELSVLLGNGDGTFRDAPASPLLCGDVPFGIAIVDLDGDRVLDIASVNSGSDDVSIFFGRGNGEYDAEHALVVGRTPFSIVTADLDGDARPDLAASNMLDDTLSVFLSADAAWR